VQALVQRQRVLFDRSAVDAVVVGHNPAINAQAASVACSQLQYVQSGFRSPDETLVSHRVELVPILSEGVIGSFYNTLLDRLQGGEIGQFFPGDATRRFIVSVS